MHIHVHIETLKTTYIQDMYNIVIHIQNFIKEY